MSTIWGPSSSIDSTSKLTAVTSNTTITIPANYYIVGVIINNTTANAVTGGIRVGTTDGGIDVVVALAVAGNALQAIPDATLLKRLFSTTVSTTLYIQTVTLWNSASLNLTFLLANLT